MTSSRDITRLLEIMAALRDPETGCPWDVKQDFASIKPYTIEEAYEVADAIERNDPDDLCDELGDLLLQVVFHAQIAAEKQLFSFGDVVDAITRKMIRRHPHIFAASEADTAEAVKIQWDDIKANEKRERTKRRAGRGLEAEGAPGLLDDVPRAFPALTEALKLQQKASKVGFDWGEAGPVLDKIEEEVSELRAAIQTGDAAAMKDELGDITFALANLGRHLKADPEEALRGTNTKFRRRFAYVEAELGREGVALSDASLDQMEAFWQAAKRAERGQ